MKIIYFIQFTLCLLIASCSNQLDEDIDLGLEIYSRARLSPINRNYTDDIVHTGFLHQYWEWKYNFLDKYDEEQWQMFVQKAHSEVGEPNEKLSPSDILTYEKDEIYR